MTLCNRQTQVYRSRILVAAILTISTYSAVYANLLSGLNVGNGLAWWFQIMNFACFTFSLGTILGSRFALTLILMIFGGSDRSV